jgi:hypothetical protein
MEDANRFPHGAFHKGAPHRTAGQLGGLESPPNRQAGKPALHLPSSVSIRHGPGRRRIASETRERSVRRGYPRTAGSRRELVGQAFQPAGPWDCQSQGYGGCPKRTAPQGSSADWKVRRTGRLESLPYICLLPSLSFTVRVGGGLLRDAGTIPSSGAPRTAGSSQVLVGQAFQPAGPWDCQSQGHRETPSAPSARASPDKMAPCTRALLAGHPLPERVPARWTARGTGPRGGSPGLLLCDGTGLYGVRRDARRHDR